MTLFISIILKARTSGIKLQWIHTVYNKLQENKAENRVSSTTFTKGEIHSKWRSCLQFGHYHGWELSELPHQTHYLPPFPAFLGRDAWHMTLGWKWNWFLKIWNSGITLRRLSLFLDEDCHRRQCVSFGEFRPIDFYLKFFFHWSAVC